MNSEEYRLAQDMLISEYEQSLLQKYGLEHLLDKLILRQTQLMEKNQLLEQRLSMVDEELNHAREAQMNLLPRDIPDLDAIEFRARFFPSQYVSGDTYNVIRLDETRVAVYQIDISGHGVSSALFSVSLSHMLNASGSHNLLKSHMNRPPFYRIHEPDEVIRLLNEENFFDRYGFYLTMIYMLIDVESGMMRYSRAGHNPPIIQKADGSIIVDERGGLPLGWDFGRTDPVIEHRLQPGDRIFMYSDGICEASAPDGALFGRERLTEIIRQHAETTSDETLDASIRALTAHTRRTRFEDDVSLLAVMFKGTHRH